jgi:hypothetical protein
MSPAGDAADPVPSAGSSARKVPCFRPLDDPRFKYSTVCVAKGKGSESCLAIRDQFGWTQPDGSRVPFVPEGWEPL